MVLNTTQLLYLVEIERTRSISQAAANLYMGQPNLSRVLRDTEAQLGFPLFERTRKGVRPTEKGEQFLQHARNILREAEFVERLGPNNKQPNRFRLCIPRSYHYLKVTQSFLCSLPFETKLDSIIRECHPRQALEMLSSGQVEIGIIRYSVEYQDYFKEQAKKRELSLQNLSQESYQILVANNHPLAEKEIILQQDLAPYTEILHRDTFYPESKEKNCLYTVDRLAQLQLLQGLPNAYLRSEELPGSVLSTFHLVQRSCEDGNSVYQNALVFKAQCAMSDMESRFLQWLQNKKA